MEALRVIKESFDDCYCCPKCDNQLTPYQRFCDECGQKLNWDGIKINYDGSPIK